MGWKGHRAGAHFLRGGERNQIDDELLRRADIESRVLWLCRRISADADPERWGFGTERIEEGKRRGFHAPVSILGRYPGDRTRQHRRQHQFVARVLGEGIEIEFHGGPSVLNEVVSYAVSDGSASQRSSRSRARKLVIAEVGRN